jgi:hypothetical protein
LRTSPDRVARQLKSAPGRVRSLRLDRIFISVCFGAFVFFFAFFQWNLLAVLVSASFSHRDE